MDERNSNIVSIAKAIGIIMMVIGHSECPSALRNYIYIFHMPLFFFLSGYCFKDCYVNNKKTFVRHRLKGLYLPFVKYNLLFLCLHNFFFKLHLIDAPIGWQQFSIYSIKYIFMDGMEELLGPFWFLRYLFLSAIAFLLIYTYLGKNIKIYTSFIAVMPLVALVMCVIDLHHILSYLSFISIFFYACGNLFHHHFDHYHPLFVVPSLIAIGFASTIIHSEMVIMKSQDVIPYCLFALVGIYGTLCLASLIIDYVPFLRIPLNYIGRNTLSILTWHVLCFKILNHLYITIWQLSPNKYYELAIRNPDYKWIWITYTIIGVFVPLFMNWTHNYFISRIKNVILKIIGVR